VSKILARIDEVDIHLLQYLKTVGTTYDRKLRDELGDRFRQVMVRCKSRSLVIPLRTGSYYRYDITDLGLEVLKAWEQSQTQKSQFSHTKLITINSK
jgi:hypothetical protein